MDDLISRAVAIVALCKAGCDSGYCGASCDDVKAIENLPSAQPETHEEHTKTHARDLISRQDTVDVIASMIAYHKTLDDAYWYVKDDAPSAQPEIIRCKDCKHFAGEGMYCSCNIIVQFDHFYCYHAERRQDG